MQMCYNAGRSWSKYGTLLDSGLNYGLATYIGPKIEFGLESLEAKASPRSWNGAITMYGDSWSRKEHSRWLRTGLLGLRFVKGL